MIGYYPPTGTQGELIDNLSELPAHYELIDFNEFYRLFKDEDKHYIYKVKHPKSALNSILKK
jgi:hypothetical protein